MEYPGGGGGGGGGGGRQFAVVQNVRGDIVQCPEGLSAQGDNPPSHAHRYTTARLNCFVSEAWDTFICASAAG